MSETTTAAAEQPSLAKMAMKGSVFNSAQWFLNKVATAGAMLVIARFLTPDEYGTASQALAIVQFLVVLTPQTMGDVLIAHPRHFAILVPTARRITVVIALAMGVLVVASIPVVTRVYDKYPAAWLGSLLALLALRPPLEALLLVPVSRLRMNLEYKRIAVIDGVVQFCVTVSSLMAAMLGARAASIVAPQIAGAAARSAWYARTVRSSARGRFRRALAVLLLRAYLPAAGAQYLHNTLVMLEVLVLGYVSGDYQTGLFGFAYMLAAQANGVIAYQLGVVLQPIFGRLQDDPARQVAGFLRAQRVLGLVCVPISFLQFVMAAPLFHMAFSEKWQPAIPVFQVLSLGQAFYFATGPSMACLRSQKRFHTFFIWQGVQLALSVPLYALGAISLGAVGIAVASSGAWALSAPIAVFMCTRYAGAGRLRDIAAVFLRPWLLGAPIFAAAYLSVHWSSRLGLMGDVVSLVVIGPAALLLVLLLARRVDPDLRSLSDSLVRALRQRLGA